MNYLQNKQKAKWPNVLVDTKHSHFTFYWFRNSTFFKIWFKPRSPCICYLLHDTVTCADTHLKHFNTCKKVLTFLLLFLYSHFSFQYFVTREEQLKESFGLNGLCSKIVSSYHTEMRGCAKDMRKILEVKLE